MRCCWSPAEKAVADLDDLTRAFVATHPVDAARELERLDDADVAALLERAPARLTAPVLEAMLAPVAARCLALVSSDRAALLLGSLSPPSAVSLLRHVAEPQRRALLDALPAAASVACRALLRFPEDAIGALADTSVVALPARATAAEALAEVRRREGDAGAEVYVLADDHRLLGAVALPVLLRAAGPELLQTLLHPVASLPALMPLDGAAMHAAWGETNLLPIVEHSGRFLGALSAATLRRAVAGRPPATGNGVESLAGALAEGYWTALSSLAQAIVALLPVAGTKGR